jgi:nicotinate-nucleotide pyrophosphorylase (carboxylating)
MESMLPDCPPPLRITYEPLLVAALREDLGRAGDLTTDAIVSADSVACSSIVARAAGRLAGIGIAVDVFRLLDPSLEADIRSTDGADIGAGEELARIDGSARAILTGERVALNLLAHLSGVATATASIVAAVGDQHARVVCTRKTLPGLRALEKYAVRAGGGSNHRYGLDDAVLVKDNHIVLAGSIGEAVARVRGRVGHMVKIEVEATTLEEVEEALASAVDAVLLDNMDLAGLRSAVGLIDGRCLSEASGGIRAETAAEIAGTGVDLLSVGWLTHSAPALDVALEVRAD